MTLGRLPATLAAACVLAGCGSATSAPRADDVPAERPTAIPAADGEVRTRYVAMVLDEGDGPQLCMGPVMDSYPPQCDGLPLKGWTWKDLPTDYENVSGVRFGDFVVTGTFDGSTLTVTGAAGPEAADQRPPYAGLRSPCPEPDGGWRVVDPQRVSREAMGRAIHAAERRDDFAAAWLDQSINPAYDDFQNGDYEAGEALLNDPELLVLNIQVTGDVAEAEAQARRTWGGSLCVSKGTSTLDQRLRIQRELGDLPGYLGSAGDGSGNVVELDIVYDDGSVQRWVDATYGEGLVEVSSQLRSVD